MRDLLEAMEIGRQSLYDTFGDKHGLFLASLRHYIDIGMATMVGPLKASDGGLSAIEAYFETLSNQMCAKPNRSCFVINSSIELAPHDPEVAVIVSRFIDNLRAGFATALEVAASRGEACPDESGAVAWHLTNSSMGFGPMSKAGVPQKSLKLVAEQILKTVRA